MLNRLIRTTPGKKKKKKKKKKKNRKKKKDKTKKQKSKTKANKKTYERMLFFWNKLKRLLPGGKEGFINY